MSFLGPFYGVIAVPSITRCRCRGHRCPGGVRQQRHLVNGNAKLGGVRRLAVANEPNIFQMLLVILLTYLFYARLRFDNSY